MDKETKAQVFTQNKWKCQKWKPRLPPPYSKYLKLHEVGRKLKFSLFLNIFLNYIVFESMEPIQTKSKTFQQIKQIEEQLQLKLSLVIPCWPCEICVTLCPVSCWFEHSAPLATVIGSWTIIRPKLVPSESFSKVYLSSEMVS